MVIVLEGQEYYSAEEACETLGVKAATLYSYVNRGLIRSYRQGIRRRSLYLRREVDDLLRVSPTGSDNPADLIPPAESWTLEH